MEMLQTLKRTFLFPASLSGSRYIGLLVVSSGLCEQIAAPGGAGAPA